MVSWPKAHRPEPGAKPAETVDVVKYGVRTRVLQTVAVLWHGNFDLFSDRKSVILGIWAAPGALEILPKGGGRSAPPFGRVFGAPGAAQTPKVTDLLSLIQILELWTQPKYTRFSKTTLDSKLSLLGLGPSIGTLTWVQGQSLDFGFSVP